MKGNSLLPPSQFSHFRGLETCDALLALSHHLQLALERSTESRFVQLKFSSAFDMVSHRCMLYMLRCVGIAEQFLLTVLEFLCDRKQHMRLDGKVSVSIDAVSGSFRIMFYYRCCLCYTPSSYFSLLGTILWAMLILRSMQSFLDQFRVLK